MPYDLGFVHNEIHMGDASPGTVQPFVKPWMYSPQIAKTQQTTFNPMSTSLNYLARFGVAKHF